MYVRSYMVRGVCYIHLVYTCRRRSKEERVTVAVLGKYDPVRLQELRELVRDWQPLRRAPAVIEDVSVLNCPVSEKGWHARHTRWCRRCKV